LSFGRIEIRPSLDYLTEVPWIHDTPTTATRAKIAKLTTALVIAGSIVRVLLAEVHAKRPGRHFQLSKSGSKWVRILSISFPASKKQDSILPRTNPPNRHW